MPRLRIVAVNDVYSIQNWPSFRTLVDRARTVDPADVLLVTLAGDFLSPSILSSVDHGRGMVECMNLCGFTHVILGNHEDDLELPDLRARLASLTAKVLTTNVPQLGFLAHDVVDVGGVNVGLLGVVDVDASLYHRAPFGGATEPANDAALREAATLKDCAAVIALTHQPLEGDRALAATHRFALILGGHEHDGHIEDGPCPVVKAPSDASRAVIVDLAFEGAAAPTVRARMEDVTAYPPDATVLAHVHALNAVVEELEHAPLLLVAEGQALSSIGTRVSQTTMGTLVCSRLRDSFGADGCIFNGGGIRGGRDYQKQFTFGDLKAEVPFDNEIVVATLPGATLRDAIVWSRRLAPEENPGFLQLDDGMQVDAQNQLVSVAGAPFDPKRQYRIALIRNLLEGLDHIEPLVQFAQQNPTAVPAPTTGRDVKIALVAAFSALLFEQLGGFDAIDANHDGRVTSEELVRKLGSALSAKIVMGALDANLDQSITPDEVAAAGGRPR